MPRKPKIVLQTNAPWMKTGLGENGRYLLDYLARTGKYDLVYYGTNHVMSNDPNLRRLPCKAYGAIPADPMVIQRMNQDPMFARDVSYGAHFVDQIIKDEKPDIYWESDDIWSTPGYIDKPWFKEISCVFHKTPDSLPILDEAFKQARATPHYFTWAEFAAKEMNRKDPKLKVRHIYGMFNTSHFAPITKKEKLDLRRRFGLDANALIFHTTNRNQLRKGFAVTIQAFADFQKEHPNVRSKLHFHTSFSEKAQGWDIPKLAAFYGVKMDDILCTYVCRNCGQWHIASYAGEDLDCPYCGAQKSMVTANTQFGVPDEEMKLMHGVADAGLSIFDSGGLERFSVASLLCGLPTAITSYSCGEDFMNLPFVHSVDWTHYYQPQTNFIKAASKPDSIRAFMGKVAKMKEPDRAAIGEQGRAWATKTFSVETIGKQWEDVFDALPLRDWSTITLAYKSKNPGYPMPTMTDPGEWVKALYNHILLVDPDPEGFKYWVNALANGQSRENIYGYFVKVAAEDNAKNAPPQDFGVQLDRENGRKRGLMVIKESIGDCLMLTSLFESFHQQYPDTDLYVATDPKFFEIFAGNPHVKKTLPWMPQMDNELLMCGAGQKEGYFHVYMNPAIGTQKLLDYLFKDAPAFPLGMEAAT